MANVTQGTLHGGRSNTILVFGRGGDSVAVVSSVIVRIVDQAIGERIRFSGLASFAKKTLDHITSVILPMVDRVCEILGLPRKSFEMSVVNLGAASIMGVSLRISGYSADAPIALAMLSARLEMAVPQSIAVTGHIASVDGDITMVTSIPAKLKAAIKEETINLFIHPSLEKDGSLDSLSPNEKQRIAGAIATAKRSIRLIDVRDISDSVKAVFSDEQIVLASLKQGFYEGFTPGTHIDSPIGKTAKLLGLNNEDRFWKSLERQLMEGRNEDIGNLLHALANFHLEKKIYPKSFGHKLLQLIQSLPPETRRFKVDFPLLHITDCIQLTQFAKESDHEDVKALFKATSGEIIGQSVRVTRDSSSGDAVADEYGNDKLSLIFSEIDADALAAIGHPIDLARATYLLNSVTVRSNNDLVDTITSFFVHIIRHSRKISEPVNLASSGAEALALLERAFSRNGGFNAALTESKMPVNGGLRLILDKMTEQFKMEQQEKHVNHVLKSVLDPLDWESKVSLMEALLKRLHCHLPSDIVSQPPDRFAGKYEGIVKAYVRSSDKMKSLFRSL